ACIIGGGDTAMICAAHGHFDVASQLHAMNPWQEEYYRAWAVPFFQSVRKDIGFVDCSVYHLWHGTLQDRRFKKRHEDLGRFAFNPYLDIKKGPAWSWNTAKPELHQYVRDYFTSRNEDGIAVSNG